MVDIKGLANDVDNSNNSKFSFQNEEDIGEIRLSDSVLFTMLISVFNE